MHDRAPDGFAWATPGAEPAELDAVARLYRDPRRRLNLVVVGAALAAVGIETAPGWFDAGKDAHVATRWRDAPGPDRWMASPLIALWIRVTERSAERHLPGGAACRSVFQRLEWRRAQDRACSMAMLDWCISPLRGAVFTVSLVSDEEGDREPALDFHAVAAALAQQNLETCVALGLVEKEEAMIYPSPRKE